MSKLGTQPGTENYCRNGHLYVGANVMVGRDGREGIRECQTCRDEARRRAAARKREKRAENRPVSVLPPMDFLGDGACRETDPTLFEAMTRAENHECHGQPALLDRIKRAMAVCGQCPIRARCGEWAAAVGEQGVWGGQYMSRDTRRRKGAA